MDLGLFLILFFLFPLGQLIRLPLGIPGVSVYIHDLVLVAIWVLLVVGGNLKNIFAQRQSRRIFIFTGIALLSWLINLSKWRGESILGLAYLVRWLALTGPYFAIFKFINHKSKILNLLRFSVLLTAIFGWIQYLFFPDLTHLKYFGWDDHYYRLTGTFLDPNFMGIILVLGLGLEFARKRSDFFRKLFLLVTLAFTYSRSSWLAWLVLLFGWAVKKHRVLRNGRIRQALVWFFVSAIIFYLLPRPVGEGGNLLRTASTRARFQNWQESWQVIKQNPIFGIGFNNYQLAGPGGQKADNSFLLVWATTGIFGLIAFVWLVFGWQPFWLILPLAVHSLFNNSLFYPWVLMLVWGIQGAKRAPAS